MKRSTGRHDRLFKAIVVGATALTMAVIALANRRACLRLFAWARGQRVGRSTKVPQERIHATRERARDVFGQMSPLEQRLLDAAGLAPDRALFAQANLDTVMAFSSKVFQQHSECGYRFRPGMRALWVEWTLPEGFPAPLLVPDTPEIRECAAQLGKRIFSTERYNALGFRGPEPDPNAAVRVLELGDSFLHGILLDEHETPSAQLEQALQKRLRSVTVSVFNTGVIGYSTEQEYHTLVEQYEHFRPNVVILHFFANDVHPDYQTVLETGEGDWHLAWEWIERIQQFCRARHVPIQLVSMIPARPQLTVAGRSLANYQGKFTQGLPLARNRVVDSLDALVLANERLRATGVSDWRMDATMPVFLRDDAHFSPAGAAAYAAVVADYVLTALERFDH